MQRTATVVFCLFVLATLTPNSSAKPAPLEAPDPGRGIIGVRVKVIPPAKMGTSSADAVYFVRVVEDADRFGAESFITSSYSKGRNVYLLNAKPGRYVAIGCMFAVGATAAEGTVVFSKADILQTEVEVRAGAVVFMGEIDAQSSTKTGEADEAQAHYLRIVAPTAAKQGFMGRAFSGNYAYIAAFKGIERGGAAETEFWAEATEKHFKDEPAWVSRIAGRAASPVGVATGSTSAGATEATSPATPLSKLVGEWGLTVFVMGGGQFGGPRCGKSDRPGPSPVNIALPGDGAVALAVGCDNGSDYAFQLKYDAATHAYLITVKSREGISIDDFPVGYVEGQGWKGAREQVIEGKNVSITATVAPIEGENWSGWMIAVLPTADIDRELDDIKTPYFRADLTRRK